jgi:HD superfamily phosphohydrolase
VTNPNGLRLPATRFRGFNVSLIFDLPELTAMDDGGGVRIPPGDTVPLTPRVRAVLDTPPLRRLAGVSQLGLVALVYPGAVHNRLEHSLGVYRLAVEFLRRLAREPRFAAAVSPADAAAFLVAALVHDVGHWAYCHPLEDMGLTEFPRHESRLGEILTTGELGEVIRREWAIEPSRVVELVAGTASDPAARILGSLLSGPIDVDKMDYLSRDSLHAGVPYGRNFDQDRLLSSLCLDAAGESLAITAKGRTAAELMVFARYVMFSEVYWHHAVRAATAMLQRAVWLLRPDLAPDRLVHSDDRGFVAMLTKRADGTPAAELVDGLFGPARRLFKRAATYDATHAPAVHKRLAGRGYAEMVAISARLADLASRQTGRPIAPHTLIVDAPPAEREVEFRLQVRERSSRSSEPTWRWLEELSPVVRSLAHEQFDSLVKRVRIFAPAEQAAQLSRCEDLDALLLEAAGE